MSAVLFAPLETLVLNADFRPLATWPLSTVTARKGVKAVWGDGTPGSGAYVVENWPDAVFRSASINIAVPKVIALKAYSPIYSQPKFCRRSVLLRDRSSCQFCGHRFPSEELTFDHVIPRSQGGTTCWENILMACVACNKRKRDEMPNYSGRRGKVPLSGGLRPLKTPRQPTTAELLRAGMDLLDLKARETWGDYLYWSAPLDT